ncbi:MAG: hypothetical protein LBF49_01820 [Puniceicoccales bacterium]|nr:hypothetical protein [Puniceicoccales bacterium]
MAVSLDKRQYLSIISQSMACSIPVPHADGTDELILHSSPWNYAQISAMTDLPPTVPAGPNSSNGKLNFPNMPPNIDKNSMALPCFFPYHFATPNPVLFRSVPRRAQPRKFGKRYEK